MLANLSEEAIFHAALAIAAAEERCAYLDAACGEPDLRRRVEALLRRCAESRGPLDRPAASLAASADEPPAEGSGSLLGPYELSEQLGEVGLGSVCVAGW